VTIEAATCEPRIGHDVINRYGIEAMAVEQSSCAADYFMFGQVAVLGRIRHRTLHRCENTASQNMFLNISKCYLNIFFVSLIHNPSTTLSATDPVIINGDYLSTRRRGKIMTLQSLIPLKKSHVVGRTRRCELCVPDLSRWHPLPSAR